MGLHVSKFFHFLSGLKSEQDASRIVCVGWQSDGRLVSPSRPTRASVQSRRSFAAVTRTERPPFNTPWPWWGGAAAAAARIYSHNALQIPKVNLTSSNSWTRKRINDACSISKRNRKHVCDLVGAFGSSLFFSAGNVARF